MHQLIQKILWNSQSVNSKEKFSTRVKGPYKMKSRFKRCQKRTLCLDSHESTALKWDFLPSLHSGKAPILFSLQNIISDQQDSSVFGLLFSPKEEKETQKKKMLESSHRQEDKVMMEHFSIYILEYNFTLLLYQNKIHLLFLLSLLESLIPYYPRGEKRWQWIKKNQQHQYHYHLGTP